MTQAAESDRTGEVDLPSGERLPYLVRGSGPPVVLLAPAGTSPRVWHGRQIPALVDDGFQIVTIDYMGMRQRGVTPPRHLSEIVAGVGHALGVLGLRDAALLGASMGGVIAQDLAISIPDRVGCCVLMATIARLDRFRRADAEAYVSLTQADIVQPASYRAVTMAQRLLSPTTLDDERRIAVWLRLFAARSADERVVEELLALRGLDDREHHLSQLCQPSLVLSFADDRVAPPHLGRELAHLLPCAEFVNIGNAGHLGFLEQPEAANAAILEFLKRMRDIGAIAATQRRG